jgi:hypothetical protein
VWQRVPTLNGPITPSDTWSWSNQAAAQTLPFLAYKKSTQAALTANTLRYYRGTARLRFSEWTQKLSLTTSSMSMWLHA